MATISKGRFAFGVIVFVFGFCCPLFIPLVASTGLGTGLKTAVSGFLAIGAPEIFMILAVSILGKDGYAFLKEKLFRFLIRISPDHVSRTRYHLGLVLFITPLIIGWVIPYVALYFESLHIGVWLFVTLDVMFLFSFIVLGGDFWEKFRRLFIHQTDPGSE